MLRWLLVLLLVEGCAAIYLGNGMSLEAAIAAGVFSVIVGLIIWATFVDTFVGLVDELYSQESETRGPRRYSRVLLPLKTENGQLKVLRAIFRAPFSIAVTLVVAIGSILALDDVPDSVLPWVVGSLGVVFAAGFAYELRSYFRYRHAEEVLEAQEEQQGDDEDLLGKLVGKIPAVRRRRAQRQRERDEAARLAKPRPYRLNVERPGVLVFVLAIGAAIILPALILGESWLGGVLVTGVILFIGLWRIAALSNTRFVWLGLSVFLSVPLFGTFALMAQNFNNPQVQPVALIRSSDGPDEAIQGIYVTETDDRVYFANVATDGCDDRIRPRSGRLLWVPKKEVVAMSIGPLQDVEKAGRSAVEMAYALTPDVETLSGRRVSLEVDEDKVRGSTGKSGHRLEDSGPAVRPEFGRGLQLDPTIAEPGGLVKLQMTVQEGEGFGREPEGITLRLNGEDLPIIHDEWSEDSITFEVPETATSGAVTIGCRQLVGQPYLTVSRKPEARISVKMRPGSNRVRFDSRRSTDDGEIVEREWAVSGLTHGDGGEQITRALPPRTGFYRVRLTVTDDEGETDTAVVRLLRLRVPQFAFDRETPERRRIVGDMLKAVSRMAKEDVRQAVRRAKKSGRDWHALFDPPAAIQINGHADDVGTPRYNARLAWRRAIGIWEELDGKGVGRVWAKAEPVPKLTIRGFGESCPLDPSGGRLRVNRRVEVFVLGAGARLIHPPGCHAAQVKRAAWGDSSP